MDMDKLKNNMNNMRKISMDKLKKMHKIGMDKMDKMNAFSIFTILSIVLVIVYWLWVAYPVMFYTYFGNEFVVTIIMCTIMYISQSSNNNNNNNNNAATLVIWLAGFVFIFLTGWYTDSTLLPLTLNVMAWLCVAMYCLMTAKPNTNQNPNQNPNTNTNTLLPFSFVPWFSLQPIAPKTGMFTPWIKHMFYVIALFAAVCVLYVYNPHNIMRYVGGPIVFLSLFVGMAFAVFILSHEHIPIASVMAKSAFVFIAIVVLLGLFFVTVYVLNHTSMSIVGLVLNVLLIVVFVIVAVRLVKNNGGIAAVATAATAATAATTMSMEWRVLYLVIAICIVYMIWLLRGRQWVINRLMGQGNGLQLLKNTAPTEKQTSIAPPSDLTHRFGISFWFYLNSSVQNNNFGSHYNIVSFGDYPSVTYHNNSLYIYEHDRLLYVQHNVYLQKWNHVFINSNGGTLDIFYNGELVRSNIEVVPYIKQDMFVIGQEHGMSGDVANIVYFREPVDLSEIQTIYKTLKDSNPP